jgi:RNA polymerase sigma factor (TIGR02999 family)
MAIGKPRMTARLARPMNEPPRHRAPSQPANCYRAEELLPLVYDSLRKLAAQKLVEEQPGQTLQATALVHEAFLRLTADNQDRQWENRGHFYAAAAEAMRRILVEAARRRQTLKRGGTAQRVELEPADLVELGQPLDLLALDEALEKLAREQPLKAELVKLRFFAGLTMPAAAELLGVSLATAERHWMFTRAWLLAELEGESKKLP